MSLLAPMPNREFDRLHQLMEGMFDSEPFSVNWPSYYTRPNTVWTPFVDIAETDKAYTLAMDLPGFQLENIDVSLNDGVLTISGKRDQHFDEKKHGKVIRYERRYGTFSRSFVLNAPVKANEIEASFANGVLTVTAPKTKSAETTKIPIKV